MCVRIDTVVREVVERLVVERCAACDGPYCEMHAYRLHWVGCPAGGTCAAKDCPKLRNTIQGDCNAHWTDCLSHQLSVQGMVVSATGKYSPWERSVVYGCRK